ncbi:flagellar protein FlgN [Lentibacillus salinarum]|uniref:Flagellar protein FlgN n=1 Tax=Lentibacillus salinarum TaxID=446820 RepID=A0ABW3ZTL0_9BACI
MSVYAMIQAMEKLLKLHEGLLDAARKKTDIVKEGSVERLQTLLVKEHKYVQALEQAETNRQKAVDQWLAHAGITLKQPTMTAVLETITDDRAKHDLENIAVKLADTITQLKQQEQLNQALIRQSMQFVELSLDMMNPSLSHMNYGDKHAPVSPERSVFDSRA